MVAAVVLDLDGVLVDSESVWANARERVTGELGGRWHPRAQADMMGMSSPEWSRYMHDDLGVDRPPEEISAIVVERLDTMYRERLPLIPGATDAVERLASRWPLAVASSANRELIDLVLELAGLAPHFDATVSSEEVPRGKPAPDVYLEAARRLSSKPGGCVAVEDSANGILAASAAGMGVIAIPNREFPPDASALACADTLLASLRQLVPEVVEPLGAGERPPRTESPPPPSAAAAATPTRGIPPPEPGGISFEALAGPGNSDGG